MIEKLEQEAAEAAELKEWCDDETAKASAKKADVTFTSRMCALAANSSTTLSSKLWFAKEI